MKTLFESLSSSLMDDSQANIFVIVKPGFLKFTQYVINTFKEKGWKLERIKTKQLLPNEAKILYEPHKKEDFFEALCKYMTSEPSTALLFTKDKPMSPEMFVETNSIKEAIRNEIGESEMRNGIHSSDSLERLRIERGIYF